MYNYEKKFDATKNQIEALVDSIDNKEHLKKKLISLLNENLLSIERMALNKIQDLKACNPKKNS